MVFSSLTFIFLLLPLFLLIDYITKLIKITLFRNAGLLFVSLLFYTWGEATNVFLLIALGIINYIAGYYISKNKKSKLALTIFISLNLAVLIGYKYSIWILSFIVPSLLGKTTSLPLGISFFTFHAISYLIDVYRKQIPPAKSSLNFLAYFCMFPHLVAGPIVRYAQVSEELPKRGPNKELFSFGMYRFLVGLNKKVILANSVAIIADSAFTMSWVDNLSFFDAWLGIIAYALQIYFDFSGYSDMAIGLAAMAGFKFSENFRRPYSSSSIQDFWRRWHISLSSWLRDYLYIPLGGNKSSNFTTYKNLLIVFLLCGLWHGANVTFIIWGLWHGVFLIIERFDTVKSIFQKIPKFFLRCYALLVVLIGWVFFRAENFKVAGAYLKDMFTVSFSPPTLIYHNIACIAIIIGTVICLLPDKLYSFPTCRNTNDFSFSEYCFQGFLAILSITLLLARARNPFIYFNF